jgi:hypothetical protein
MLDFFIQQVDIPFFGVVREVDVYFHIGLADPVQYSASVEFSPEHRQLYNSTKYVEYSLDFLDGYHYTTNSTREVFRDD